MRYFKYLIKEEEDDGENKSTVAKALNIEEPKVGSKYPPELVKRNLDAIDAALKDMRKKKDKEATQNANKGLYFLL